MAVPVYISVPPVSKMLNLNHLENMATEFILHRLPYVGRMPSSEDNMRLEQIIQEARGILMEVRRLQDWCMQFPMHL